MNDLSSFLNVDTILSTAEGIYHQIVSAPHLTDPIRVILGLPALDLSASAHSDSDTEGTASKTVQENGTAEGNDYSEDADEVMYQIGLDLNF